MKTKKAQMKIQQMAFMLIAVTLFFVFVGLFVLVIQFSNLKESSSVLEEKNALLLVTKIANSPEFSCGGAFGGGRISCIDSDKVMILRENINKYEGFWGVENIEIRKIYPLSEYLECTGANYPNCSIIRLKQSNIGEEHSNFVSLCRKESVGGNIEDKCELAKLIIAYE